MGSSRCNGSQRDQILWNDYTSYWHCNLYNFWIYSYWFHAENRFSPLNKKWISVHQFQDLTVHVWTLQFQKSGNSHNAGKEYDSAPLADGTSVVSDKHVVEPTCFQTYFYSNSTTSVIVVFVEKDRNSTCRKCAENFCKLLAVRIP